MKGYLAIVLAVLAWGFSEPRNVVAQVVYYNNGRLYQGGMFGDRTLGQPLAPRPNNFDSGIQTAPSGAFLYIGNQTSAGGFATPWRQVDPLVALETLPQSPGGRPVVQVPALLEGVPGSPLPPGIAAAGAVPTEFFTAPPGVPPEATGAAANAAGVIPTGAINPLPIGAAGTVPITTQATNTAPPAQVAPISTITGRPATANVALSSNTQPTAPAGQVTFVRSARLSELVTRVALSRKLLVGQGVNVYVGNHVAVLQGTVRTADGGATLANVVNLEPNIWQVENRLTVARPAANGAGTAPAQSSP
jgi:hypothetical protein